MHSLMDVTFGFEFTLELENQLLKHSLELVEWTQRDSTEKRCHINVT